MRSGAAPFSEQRRHTRLDSFLLSRATAHVDRWHVWPTLQRETDAEHHAITARISFFVATLVRRHGIENVDPDRIAVFALFHDEPEVFTGDVPRRAKDRSRHYEDAVHHLDLVAQIDLVEAAPASVAEQYSYALSGPGSPSVEKEILKYADELAALAFVCDEIAAGNERMRDVWQGLHEAVWSYSWPWLVALREKEPDLP